MSHSHLSSVCTLLFLITAAQAWANPTTYERAIASSVWIRTPTQCSGSGALVDVDRRLIVTNFHVVEDCSEVTVYFPRFENGMIVAERDSYLADGDHHSIRGRVLCSRREQDLALIELETLPAGIHPLLLAKNPIRPGEPVHSIGNPGVSDFLWVYSPGFVRQSGQRRIEFSDGHVVQARMIETTSPVNPGDSGGPLLNDGGELVGVVQSFNVGANQQCFCVDVSEISQLLASDLTQPDPAKAPQKPAKNFISHKRFQTSPQK